MKAAVALALVLGAACVEPNYTDPDGPRYAGDHVVTGPELGDELLVVAYNLELGREIDVAIAALSAPPLAGADVVAMQEMDPGGVARIAAALGLRYVYYPASVKFGRDWGNAVLTPWPITADRKLILPHADPYTNTRRTATRVDIVVNGTAIAVYSAHTATPSLGLGARLDQAETIAADTGAGAVIVAGDLNTADPGSTSQTLEIFEARELQWASPEVEVTASVFGVDLVLDHVFSRDLAPLSSGSFAGEAGSDHRPIFARLAPP